MSAHTPGPWFVATCAQGEDCWCRLVVTKPVPSIPGGDYEIEDCVIASGAVGAENARLIAAAPELLAFVDKVARDFADAKFEGSVEWTLCRLATALVAKATGGQP